MAIRIACSRLLLKILADFQLGVYLQKSVLIHATTHSLDRCKQLKQNEINVRFSKNNTI